MKPYALKEKWVAYDTGYCSNTERVHRKAKFRTWNKVELEKFIEWLFYLKGDTTVLNFLNIVAAKTVAEVIRTSYLAHSEVSFSENRG